MGSPSSIENKNKNSSIMKKAPLLILLVIIILVQKSLAQNDLMNLLDENVKPEINYTSATFKSTRILNGHSIERMKAGQLDFRISHRFGPVNSGAYNLWGLDQSSIRFGFEYGITNWLMAGIGRSSFEKTYDGFLKFSPIRQSTGAKVMPVSVSVFTSVAVKTLKPENTTQTNYFSSNLSYVGQVLIARKFSQIFSAQVTPTYVHRNMVPTELDPNDLFAMGIGGRIKLSKRISLNAEYYYVVKPIPDRASVTTYNPLSLGIDIETGGHVFQIIVTNSLGMIEKSFIGETTEQWRNGGIHLGFNISRVFTLKNYNK
jgi:hypothetical protein